MTSTMNWTTLVSPETLVHTLGREELRIVDARYVMGSAAPDAGRQAWRQSHIPGATYVDLDRDLSDHAKPAGEGRHPLPDAQAFVATLRRLGISRASQVVVYDGADGAMAAARFWWLMRLLGHARVAVLDGGFAAWSAQGFPVATTATEYPAGNYPELDFDASHVVGHDEISRRTSEPKGWLIDARAPERFRGEVEPLDRVAGHIPGAANRPYLANLRDGRFLPAEQLREQWQAVLQGRETGDVVLSCGSGVTACHNLLAMEHAGLGGARVYAGSWSGWTSDASRPVATGN